jgi:hypothetical protein
MPRDFTKELDAYDRKLRSEGYEPLKPFFVLKESVVQDERTGGTVKFDKARLERIADTQNERIATTGDATPIIIGHTRKHLLEKDQPPITGLATRFEVTRFGKVWGLQAVPWAKPADKENFAKYPRRSCEVWTDPDLIDPISLLGANTPRLDLGLHQLSRGDVSQQLALSLGYTPRTPLTLELGAMPTDDNDDKGGSGDSGKPATPGNVSAAQGTQTSDFAQLRAQVEQLTQQMSLLQPLLAELQMDPSMGGGMGGPPGGGMGGPPPGPGGPGGPPGGGMGGPPPGPIQAMGTPPGGGNAMLPQQFGQQGGPMQFQHVGYGNDGSPLFRQVQAPVPASQQPLQFGQYGQAPQPMFTPPTAAVPGSQTETEQLRVQVAQLQLARLGDEVNMILNDLDTKIVIDRQRDYNDLIKLEKPQRDQAIQFMLATRKPKEEPVPPEALPLQFHAQPPAPQVPVQNAPVQLAGISDGMYMPPDPTLGRQAPGAPKAVSTHDALMEIVRNRGKLSATAAFDQAIAAARNGGSQNGIPVR